MKKLSLKLLSETVSYGRKAKKLTQAQLARKLKVSPSSIGMYEQGRREPNNKILSKICRELNATGDYILNLEEDESQAKDVCLMLEQFAKYIETRENIMLNGKPIQDEDKKKISNALRVATAVALSENKNKK